MLNGTKLSPSQAADIPLRQLAHVGDAVFHLYVREKEVLIASSAKEMHKRTAGIVSYKGQAKALHKLTDALTVEERDLVRRARNMKPAAYRRSEQALYRKATAFEALLGYLYLTDIERLNHLLELVDAQQAGKNGDDGGESDDHSENE
ncbi:MAG TPA: Mini-ribonuclease 3 [Candidatus Melainabacteria bacterium]|jgi:ribonuclease III family protein|nr:Mini-ribonuclease 3 [Candidatus Melainabacteria bacterium]